MGGQQPDTPMPTGSPTCSDKKINVCIAVDMSGSICWPPNDTRIGTCVSNNQGSCVDKCHDDTLTRGNCCQNFVKQKEFLDKFIDHFSADTDYSLVSFADLATLEQGMITGQSEIDGTISSLVYSGGGTNTGDAIRECHSTFDLQQQDEENVIVIVTDGKPTRSPAGKDKAKALEHAMEQANAAKGNKIRIVTVTVSTGATDTANLASLSSPDSVISTDEFYGLDTSLAEDLANLVKCDPIVLAGASIPEYPGIDPPELDCNPKDIDFCFALDESGSVCTPEAASGPLLCNGCPDDHRASKDCHMAGYDKSTCCKNFDLETEFTKLLVASLSSYSGSQNFALVEFATEAKQVLGLAPSQNFISTMNNVAYLGGYTNTGAAIEDCASYLDDAKSDNKYIILITDGKPTTCDAPCGGDYQEDARTKAERAKLSGNTIVTVGIKTKSTDRGLLKELATQDPDGNDKYFIPVADFEALNVDKVNDIVELVMCDDHTPGSPGLAGNTINTPAPYVNSPTHPTSPPQAGNSLIRKTFENNLDPFYTKDGLTSCRLANPSNTDSDDLEKRCGSDNNGCLVCRVPQQRNNGMESSGFWTAGQTNRIKIDTYTRARLDVVAQFNRLKEGNKLKCVYITWDNNGENGGYKHWISLVVGDDDDLYHKNALVEASATTIDFPNNAREIQVICKAYLDGANANKAWVAIQSLDVVGLA